MNEKRSSFTSKIGFVLSAAGSAVGLGNIWRFPYLADSYGGGIFLLVYIVLAVTFGFALMSAEIALGRKTGLSAIGAFKKLDKRFSFVGYLASIVPMIILPYYSVIGGWVIKYLWTFLAGGASLAANPAYFDNFIIDPKEALLFFAIYATITFIIVWFGVEKGIEKASKILMPALVVLTIVIAGYVVTLPGAMKGVLYYITPDFSKFSVKTVLGAMGQLFYSMSLAMGIMITYGSYMKKDVHIESSVKQIELFDTGIAILAGLMVIPAVHALGNGEVKSGPGLMFQALPMVFDNFAGGHILGILFFILVLFAALTSSISLMETVVSIFCDKLKANRKIVCGLVYIGCLLLGIPSALGYGPLSSVQIIGMAFLDFFDFISNSVIMPIVAFLTCVFVGYFIKPKTLIDEIELTGKFKQKGLFTIMVKYIAPIFIVLILLSSVLGAFGIFKI